MAFSRLPPLIRLFVHQRLHVFVENKGARGRDFRLVDRGRDLGGKNCVKRPSGPTWVQEMRNLSSGTTTRSEPLFVSMWIGSRTRKSGAALPARRRPPS